MEQKTLFIIGSGRSGTTLVQRLVNSIDSFYIWGEHEGVLDRIAPVYERMMNSENIIRGTFEPLKKNSEAKLIKDPTNWSAWSNRWNEIELKNIFTNFVRDLFAPEKENDTWGFKEIRYGDKPQVLNFLVTLFPASKFILMVRNPLEVIRSQISTFRYNKEKLNDICNRWVLENSRMMEFYEANKNRSHLIKYEDFVENGEKVLKEIAGFLSISEESMDKNILTMKEGRGVDPNRDRREELLTEEELSTLIEITKNTAQKFGYNL